VGTRRFERPRRCSQFGESFGRSTSYSLWYPVKAVDSENALLHWSAQSASANVDLGVDTFVIRDGRIVLQTVSYQLKHAPSGG